MNQKLFNHFSPIFYLMALSANYFAGKCFLNLLTSISSSNRITKNYANQNFLYKKAFEKNLFSSLAKHFGEYVFHDVSRLPI